MDCHHQEAHGTVGFYQPEPARATEAKRASWINGRPFCRSGLYSSTPAIRGKTTKRCSTSSSFSWVVVRLQVSSTRCLAPVWKSSAHPVSYPASSASPSSLRKFTRPAGSKLLWQAPRLQIANDLKLHAPADLQNFYNAESKACFKVFSRNFSYLTRNWMSWPHLTTAGPKRLSGTKVQRK